MKRTQIVAVLLAGLVSGASIASKSFADEHKKDDHKTTCPNGKEMGKDGKCPADDAKKDEHKK